MRVAQYVVARYSPSPSTGEAINVGVIVHCPEDEYLGFRFLPNFSKVRILYGTRDAKALEGYVADFLLPSLKEMEDNPAVDEYLPNLAERFSGNLQFTPPRGTSAKDLDSELESLYRTFVAWRGETHRKAHPITDSMLRARVKQELSEYLKRQIIRRGPDLGTWASPDFAFKSNSHSGMIYVQSLAKGVGDEIKHYAEQLAGNIFLTRKRLQLQSPIFYTIIHPPTNEDQQQYYGDCLEIIRESEAMPYEFAKLEAFKRQVLDATPSEG